MKWELASLERFKEHKEYIDTAVIPVVEVSLSVNYKESLELATWLTGIAHALEEQLTGRVMLFPPKTYVEILDYEARLQDLQITEQYLHEHQFNYVAFLQLSTENNEHAEEEKLSIVQIPLPEVDEENNFIITKGMMEKVSRKLATNLINLWQK